MAHLSLGSLSSLVIFSEAFRWLRADLPFSLLVSTCQECPEWHRTLSLKEPVSQFPVCSLWGGVG